MQGSVWTSLKCTATLDQLNKSLLQQEHLIYNYKGDSNIRIGVLDMIDDTLSISKCGNSSVQKNAILNSFIETQKLTLSEEKSVVLHVGKNQNVSSHVPPLRYIKTA